MKIQRTLQKMQTEPKLFLRTTFQKHLSISELKNLLPRINGQFLGRSNSEAVVPAAVRSFPTLITFLSIF